MKRLIASVLSALLIITVICAAVFAQTTNPLFKEEKVKNYLPHMTWKEVEQALKKTDMIIMPVGAIEQHGKHLPLCTDIYAVIEKSKLIAQKTDILVAPSLFVGLSEHHMAFPGTMTLSPETFEAVLYESAQSLFRHGFKKFLIYNGHGGNTVSCNNVIQKINQTMPAVAVFLNDITVPPGEEREEPIPFDSHAGVGETSSMLYLTNSLVNMSHAEKPVLTFPPEVMKLQENYRTNANLRNLSNAYMFRPKKTGKKGSTREMTNNGVFSTGDPKDATIELTSIS